MALHVGDDEMVALDYGFHFRSIEVMTGFWDSRALM